jgi:acrylyl-CoA reductase (NADPH)
MAKFNALMLRENEGKIQAGVEQVDDSELPEGDVLVRIDYSTINYKDGMIVSGIGGLVRNYPHVPGIDFAGTVEESNDPALKPGDKVVLNGWRVGESRWGGYAQKARVKAGQLVKLPDNIDTKRAMAIGTAGYTAMLAINTLERHGVTPAAGKVLVTGAAGGVGSVAVALLAKLGYEVAASTGRPEQADYLRGLGASEIVDRNELSTIPSRPLDAERWAATVDSVGGSTLSTVLVQTKYRGAVAACGLAGGRELNTSVMPFILRGVALLGIDSVMCPMPERAEAWERLGRVLPMDRLDAMTEVSSMADLPKLAKDILAGQVRGRMVIDVNR